MPNTPHMLASCGVHWAHRSAVRNTGVSGWLRS